MKISGGCYCGEIKYEADGEPRAKIQCHCRECQYFSGGHPNVVLGMSNSDFKYSKGAPKTYTRNDLDTPRNRDFCSNFGTHLLTRSPSLPDGVLIKVGTLDDPSIFIGADVVIQTADKQSFHHIPEGTPKFERFKS
jgi:hypothetical protein